MNKRKKWYKKIRLSRTETIDEHRYVMEKFLWRKLRKNEIVHHIDWDKRNNVINNLLLMNDREHRIFHQLWRKYSDEYIEKCRLRWITMLSSAKLNKEKVLQIKKLFNKWLSCKLIWEIFWIHRTNVWRIKKWLSWSWIK
jgi:hypothetical protein